MKTFLKVVGVLVAVLALFIGGVFGVARMSDGPIAIAPGGPLESGEWVNEPVSDWSFAADVMEIEYQLAYDNTSRTVWVLVHEGEAYIPCSLGFPPFKNWHKKADQDGSAIVRIAGQKYPITMNRIDDETVIAALREVGGNKYGAGPPSDAGVWYFRLDPREA